MAHIRGHLRVDAPAERVFDTVADSRNEPSFNPSMREAVLLTPPPVGPGSRFRARMGRSGMPMLVEITGFDRPRRLGSHTASPLMETDGAMTFTPTPGGTDMAWDWRVRPKGWMRLLGPLVGPLGSRMERRIWTACKVLVEAGGPPGRSGHS
jgi:hypothetical protein